MKPAPPAAGEPAAVPAGGAAACVPVTLRRIQRGETARLQSADVPDEVAAEMPLTLRVEGRAVAVVMRTPGHDRELAAGFLLTEGVIRSRADLFEISLCPSLGGPGSSDLSDRSERSDGSGGGKEGEPFFPGGGSADIMLANPAAYDPERLTRHVFTSSSCGVCGKTDLESTLAPHGPALRPAEGPLISAEELFALPARLRSAQAAFAVTGGLHGCAWFPAEEGGLRGLADSAKGTDRSHGTYRTYPAGAPLPASPAAAFPSAAARPQPLADAPALVFEDVGRHNALDKLLGSALLSGRLPLSRGVLLLSGRISFELVQKAAAGGIPVIAAIGAPSSLAVNHARAAGVTLCGFLRGDRVNVYTHPERVVFE